MGYLIDTDQLLSFTRDTVQDLIVSLRKKGYPIPDDTSLCDIVSLINSGAVSYCGFVRCSDNEDVVYFADDLTIIIDATLFGAAWDGILVYDFAKTAKPDQKHRKSNNGIIPEEFSAKRIMQMYFFGTGDR